MRRPLALAVLGALGLASACAPATTYVPTSFVVPMFSGPGQVHTSLQGGPQGIQLNAAYALARHLSLRLTGHTQSRDDGRYSLVSAGGAWFTGRELRAEWAPALRASVAADLGVADVRGSLVREVNGLPRGELYNSFGYRVALQGDLGVAMKWVELAGVTRFVYLSLHHSSDSSTEFAGTTAEWWFFEPGAVLRVGPEGVRLEAQAGWSKPIAEDGFVGEYRRWWWTLGVVGALE